MDPPPPDPGPWAIGGADTEQAYRIEQRTTLRDVGPSFPAAGASDTAATEWLRTPSRTATDSAVGEWRVARATLELVRRVTRDSLGTLDVSGTVVGLTVDASPHVAYRAPSVPSVDSVRPAQRPDSAGPTPILALPRVALRAHVAGPLVTIVAQPPLVNECEAPEVAALDLARPLLVRIPTHVAVGDHWRDTALTLVCRGGIPITLRADTEWVVLGRWRDVAQRAAAAPDSLRATLPTFDDFADAVRTWTDGEDRGRAAETPRLVLSYTRRTAVDGERATRWETRALDGLLDAHGMLLLDAERGLPLVLVETSHGPLTLTQHGGAPDTTTRTITQTVTVRVVAGRGTPADVSP